MWLLEKNKININIAYDLGADFQCTPGRIISPETGDTGKRAQNTENRDIIHPNFGDITNDWIPFYFQYMAIGIC
jgi:hypothetical protein